MWIRSLRGGRGARANKVALHVRQPDLLDNGEQVDRASRSIRVTVTKSPGMIAFNSFISSRRTARASVPTQLRKLTVECLAVGADAGIADRRSCFCHFGRIF